MNFFGHAVVATWTNDDAGHVLGSMLPDFEAMVRVPLVDVHDPIIQGGIDLHHRTDEAFHRTRAFLSLTTGALDALIEAGVRRGTARAVGHIATEMFLDGCLCGEEPHVEHYLTALEVEADGSLRWQDGGRAYQRLHRRLKAWGAPRDYADASFVLERLQDALRRRPTLAILEPEVHRVAACLPALRERVRREARELLDELRDALRFQD